ncbi:MAG: hypothetical protein AMXMBFR12_02700 [Candidatus Babeliales bacterium]
MATYVLPAHINQSLLNGEINLAIYIIEDYDPKTEVSSSICLSSKTHSTVNSTSSVKPECTVFEEKIVYMPNPST